MCLLPLEIMFNYSTSHYWIICQSNLTRALKGLLEVKLFHEIFWLSVIPIPTFTHNQAEHQIVLHYCHSYLDVAALKCYGSDIFTTGFLNGIVSGICPHCIRICFQSLFECRPLVPPGLWRKCWEPDENNLLCNNRSRIEMLSGSGYLCTLLSHLGPSSINRLFKPVFPLLIVVNCSCHVVLAADSFWGHWKPKWWKTNIPIML